MARARSQEGLIVVKVFVIHDPTLPLSTYKDKLEEIRSKLASAVNCLPFQRMIVSILTANGNINMYIALFRHTIRRINSMLASAHRESRLNYAGICQIFSL